MGYVSGYRYAAGPQVDNEFSPGRYVCADKEALLPSDEERLALSGSTRAVNALIDRCEAFHRWCMQGKTTDRVSKSRPGRYQNLVALHWLRMALVALIDLDRDCQANDVTDHEHAEPIDPAWATGIGPSSIEAPDVPAKKLEVVAAPA